MTKVAIIGAGWLVSVVPCRLNPRIFPVTLLEASDAPGGRVRIHLVDGFRLDRGFEVRLTPYPEARRRPDDPGLRSRNLSSPAPWYGWQVPSLR